MENELVRLEGSVSAVVFQNQENGYAVLRLKTDGGALHTVVGTLPAMTVGERLRVEGCWIEHSSYGRQLELQSAERLMPESRIEILAYLSSHAVRGVGPKIAARIVERFGADSLRIIEHEPNRLTEISGISQAKADEIHESFQSQQGLRRLAEFFSSYHLPSDLAVRVYRAYGELSMMAIQDNPYFLTEEARISPGWTPSRWSRASTAKTSAGWTPGSSTSWASTRSAGTASCPWRASLRQRPPSCGWTAASLRTGSSG